MSMEVALRIIGIFLVLLAVMIFSISVASSAESKLLSQGIQWQDYSNAVFDQAKKKKHFILLYGKSKTCHWCQEMDKTTWSVPSLIQEIQNDFIPVLVDVDARVNIAVQYRMNSLPSVIILDSDNKIIKIFTGYFPADFMEQHLKEIAGSNIQTPNNTQSKLAEVQHKNELHIVIVGSKSDPAAKELYTTALAESPLSRIEWFDRKEGPLSHSDVVYPVLEKSAAYVCHGFQCSFPIYTSRNLSGIIHDIAAPAQAAVISQTLPDVKQAPIQLSYVVSNPTNAEKLLTGKNWIFIIFGFIGFGLLLSFTPCILPLVPIMASIIVGQTIGVKKEKTFLLCLTYVLSMSFTYAFLGLLAGVFGVYLQVYMQTTWIIVLFSVIFLLLALSMLEAYELKLPNFVQQKMNKWSNLQKGGTYFGVMGMGVLATLIISPCVTAPLAGVLSFITKTSDYMLGAVGLFCMGFGMGLPLLIISLFSKNILPRAARWNDQIKSFFGIILLGVSIWIVSRVISNVLSTMLWSALIILTTIYMGITKRKTKKLFDKFWKTLTIMLFAYGVALFCNALFINSDLYRTLGTTQKTFSDNGGMSLAAIFKNIKNKTDLEQALNEDKKIHLPVLLDFSAKWCASCVEMERNVLNDPEVMSMLKRFLLLRVDLTNVDNESMELAHQFNVVAPPMVLFFDEYGQLANLRATGDLNANQFRQVLQQALDTNTPPSGLRP